MRRDGLAMLLGGFDISSHPVSESFFFVNSSKVMHRDSCPSAYA